MNLVIHSGTHGIGGNCVEIQSGDKRIIIDIGIPLERDGESFDFKKYKHMTGPELVEKKKMPDVKGLYEWDKDSKPVDAILISHAHLDHYGYMPFVNPDIPIFMSTGCKELMDIKHYFGQSNYDPQKAIIKKPWEHFNDIAGFTICPYLVDHSAADAFAYLIEADGKKVFYSGDFRGHGKKSILYENILKHPPENIDSLILEGTTIDRDNNEEKRSEQEVEEELVSIFKNKKQLVIFSCSHQDIDRLTVLYNACLRAGRTMVILPYTAYILAHLKVLSAKIPQVGMRQIRVFFEGTSSTEKVKKDKELWAKIIKSKISYGEIAKDKENLVVVDSYFVREQFAVQGLLEKAFLVYSLWEGYLEDAEKFWKDHNVPIKKIHTSGHASVKELKEFVKAVDPARIIPIHTGSAEKFRELFGEKVKVLSDGERMEL